ncbi:unnamed protein product [Staurois parvus]|uniref:Uncharacterized protein n=1 Tax=Staurois parvus TaxID=386267 RepID=A0ABN9C3J5_9NEOB|nr:unnamed protein product [Staurois parvus]
MSRVSLPLLQHWQLAIFRAQCTMYPRGGLTTHGAPGQYGIMGPLCPYSNSKKPMKKVPGESHGAPY